MTISKKLQDALDSIGINIADTERELGRDLTRAEAVSHYRSELDRRGFDLASDRIVGVIAKKVRIFSTSQAVL